LQLHHGFLFFGDARCSPPFGKPGTQPEKLADELLLQKIKGNKLLHEGQEYDLPPEREQQRILVLQLTENI